MDEDFIKVQLLLVQLQLWTEAISSQLENHWFWVLTDTADNSIFEPPWTLKTFYKAS